ncbi:MAG: hypothetical protein ACREKF_13680 [Candidatus Methylomirabilales bacterium]
MVLLHGVTGVMLRLLHLGAEEALHSLARLRESLAKEVRPQILLPFHCARLGRSWLTSRLA